MSKQLNMAKWIMALRSGKYRQTKGTLKSPDNAYCCLGVACNISKLGKWKKTGASGISEASIASIEYVYVVGKDSNGGVLPKS